MQLPLKEVFSVAVSSADGSDAGTEPSRIFKSSDQGESWREKVALTEIPSAPTWSFPPRSLKALAIPAQDRCIDPKEHL